MTLLQPIENEKQRQRWLEIALVFVVCFIAGGSLVPHVNETHYLAKAKHYWQPDWCAGDLFLESGKAHLTFYWTLGWLTKFFSLATVAWIGRVAAWLALAISWQRCSRSILPYPFAACITAILFVTLVDWTNFAGEWVVGGVEAKCFAYAFVFWGLAALAKEQWSRVWPCFGLAGAFHVLVGGWSAIATAMVWLSLPKKNRLSIHQMLPAILVGVILALPGVVPALLLAQTATVETVDQANSIYVFHRLAHHLAPLTIPSPELANKILRFSLLLLGFVWLRILCTRQSPEMTPRQQSGTPATVPSANRTSNLSQSCPLRPLDLMMRFAVATILISVTGLAWELLTWNHPILAARLLKYYFFRLADVAVPMATCMGLGWYIFAPTKKPSQWRMVLLCMAMLLPSLHLLHLSKIRFKNPYPPADSKLADANSFRDACRWIQDNTPLDALFLVPRHAQSFKWYAERPDLITWKDVPQSGEALLTWHERMSDVHKYDNKGGEYVTYHTLGSQGTKRICSLAAKYEFDYVLAEEYPPLQLPIAYSNDHYTIYETQECHNDDTPKDE